MKIFITGTKGIPNQYGGFEQFVQQISPRLVARSHEVSVYNPSFHPFRENSYGKVNIIRKFSPENTIGGAANYLYDYLCIRDAIKHKADIILECGYASPAPAYRLLNFRNSKIITHLDGFEWQRSKWSGFVRKIIKKSEYTAVRLSHGLICDHSLIRQYFRDNYPADPACIPYGSDTNKSHDQRFLEPYAVAPGGYYLVIARLEPENNIHTIIDGFLRTGHGSKLLIIGNSSNSYSHRLRKKYLNTEQIILQPGIYDESILGSLRHYSKAYFHGHSVGGTNPSLLEAMASEAMIIAHDNPFNRYILQGNAQYFTSSDDIARILGSEHEWISKKAEWVENNKRLIAENYQWDKVADLYEELFRRVLRGE
jgi:glycosyltransferase involved in cell wall biosynthesis